MSRVEDVLSVGWDKFPGSGERQAFARDEVLAVYDLVLQGDLSAAREKWLEVTISVRERFGAVLNDPDSALQGNEKAPLVLNTIRELINQLYRSTNNETLQIAWRKVTNSLFIKGDKRS